MNLPECNPYLEQAVDTVVTIINLAKSRLGVRQNLSQLADTRRGLVLPVRLPLKHLNPPLDKNGEKFLIKTIEKKWFLTPMFKYVVKFLKTSRDEMNRYFYYEVIFSQPTPAYPIPQAIVTVFFRLEENYSIPLGEQTVRLMFFTIEGQHSEHDARYVALTEDWIASVLKKKIKLYERIEKLDLF